MAISRNTALEQAIVEDMEDVATYAVYADWLAEHGDPRGELINVQLALEQQASAELERRQAEQLAARHANAWLDGLARHPALSFTWRRGFVDSIAIDHRALLGKQHHAIPCAAGAFLSRVLNAPAGLLPRVLRSGGRPPDSPKWSLVECDFDSVASALVEAKPLLSLRELHCEFPCPWADIGNVEPEVDLSPLWSTLPNLERVEAEAYEVHLGAVDAPRLQHLELLTPYGLDEGDIDSLRTARLPRLEKLVIDRADGSMGQLQPILDGDSLPSLEHLVLRQLHADVIDRFAQSRILAQLETLELTWLRTADPEPTIDRNAPAFQHLERFTYIV